MEQLKSNSYFKSKRILKTFCPLPWNHISASASGKGRVCCDGYDFLKNNEGGHTFWKYAKNLNSYFNLEDYKKIRRQMLKGERPTHCQHCFHQEDHGAVSARLQHLKQYQSNIEDMIENTNPDGSIDKPKITYIDMALGNLCNLKCRMCHPYASYIIGKDWQKMNKPYSESEAKRTLQDKWYSCAKTLNMLREALPHVKTIFITGGEPMLIKEHLDFLKMVIEEGFSNQILLRYNSNQTVIPPKIIELWQNFKKVTFNCSVEAFGELNNYIRYPSKWEKLEKNIYFLDDLSFKNKNIDIHIHTTFQAYNVLRIPELLYYMARSDFKTLYRVPCFIFVKVPQWLSPTVFPFKMRCQVARNILECLKELEEFFLNYNKDHLLVNRSRLQDLKKMCGMMKKDNSRVRYLPQFISETKNHDTIRKQSVTDILPELREFFI